MGLHSQPLMKFGTASFSHPGRPIKKSSNEGSDPMLRNVALFQVVFEQATGASGIEDSATAETGKRGGSLFR